MLSNDFSDKLELTTHVDCDNSDHIAGITQQPHEENYNDLVIKRTSPLLVELQSRIIHLLKLRMTAWAQRKRYDKELEDGKTLMIYAPQDPTGYLCVGRHYAYQGFQKQAIDTFSNGLKNIPITNIQYDALIKAKQQAEARQLNSFDILTRLSYDISCCVIDCLPQETVSECSRVSRTWRKLILEYPKVWRSISINSFNKKQALPLYMLLPYVSQHVEDLSLPCQESMDKVLNLVDENDFSNLRSLQLKRVGYGSADDYCKELGETLAKNVSKTLESLDILCANGLQYIDPILSACQNLTALRIITWNRPTCINLVSTPILSQVTLLTKLILKVEDDSVPFRVLENLLVNSPHLRWISINNPNNSVWDVLQQHCPKIKVLISHETDTWDMESECYYHNTCHGLESLSIDEDSLHNAAFPLLHKQLATLQLLRIYNYERGGVGVSIQANKIEALSTFLFPNLTILYLDRISSMLSQKLDSLIKQTPNLEKLFLNTVYNVPNGIFQCLLLLPRFSTLSMTEVEFDAHDLYQCLKGFSQRQVESSSGYLTHLSLSMCLINNAIMNVATKIQTLTNLDVSMFDIDGTPTDKAVMNFVEHITQLPKLNTLGISCWRIKMDHIQILSRCTSLRKISLWLMEDVNESQVRQAFSSDVQVEFYNWKNRWLFY